MNNDHLNSGSVNPEMSARQMRGDVYHVAGNLVSRQVKLHTLERLSVTSDVI